MKRNENEIKRKLRNVTKYYEKNENYEILRKKGNTLRKNNVIVIFYAKTVYFFIHLKNVIIAFFLFFVVFCPVLVSCTRKEKTSAARAGSIPPLRHCDANDYTSLDASIISWQPPTSDTKLSLLLSVAVIPIAQ